MGKFDLQRQKNSLNSGNVRICLGFRIGQIRTNSRFTTHLTKRSCPHRLFLNHGGATTEHNHYTLS